MNSYFIQRDGRRLYGTEKTGQQKYGVDFVLNGSKHHWQSLHQICRAPSMPHHLKGAP
jgi:hypothetical protein